MNDVQECRQKHNCLRCYFNYLVPLSPLILNGARSLSVDFPESTHVPKITYLLIAWRKGCLKHWFSNFFFILIAVSVQFSHSVMSDSLRPHGPQHASLPSPSQTPRVYSNSCPLSQWCNPTISSSVDPFFFQLNLSQHQGLFKWVSSSHQVAKVLEFQLQHQAFQGTPRADFI